MGTIRKLATILFLVALTLGVSGRVKKVKNSIPDQFNVHFKPGNNAANLRSVAGRLRGKGKAARELPNLGFVTIRGKMSQADLDELESSAGVDYVEEDAQATKSVFGGCSSYDVSDGRLWGLDAIDTPGSNGVFAVNDTVATSDDVVYVFVLDTGVEIGNPDFQGRAADFYTGYSAFADGDGHGTHCAGTIGGHYHGVSKRAFIMNAKVLSDSGSGSYSIIIEAIEAVVADHQNREGSAGYAKSVISMSLGGGKSQGLNDAVDAASAAGIVTVVAAGNSDTDASDTSPASAPTAITVGAVDSSLTLASFSNYGNVVNIQAPGVSIRSLQAAPLPKRKPGRGRGRRRRAADRVKRARKIKTTTTTAPPLTGYTPSMDLDPPSLTASEMSTVAWSGTSMACPHVAGVVAVYLIGYEGAPPSVADITTWLTNVAKTGVVDRQGKNTPDKFLQAKQC